MPALAEVKKIVEPVDGRGLTDRIEHATPGVPDDGRINVHLRRNAHGADEIRYALEEEGWCVTAVRGSGGAPLAYLVTGQ
ncbi:hypothetical protein ACFWGI_06750 [Streptomyces niveus]|uniref:hypothetical protein n=1 Tax=Streptomyces niveus TaxID=193462 RepID=UPI00365C2525